MQCRKLEPLKEAAPLTKIGLRIKAERDSVIDDTLSSRPTFAWMS
jgi:hypothetical protein